MKSILLPYSVIRIDTLLCYSGLLCWAHLQMCHPTPLYGPILLLILRNVPPYSVISHSSVNWNSRVIGVCADRDQPEFLCYCSDSRYLEVHVATAGGWLTRYHPREVRNSIYRYRKIHIEYLSKFLYRFISPISIIYGNTNNYVLITSFFNTENLVKIYSQGWQEYLHCIRSISGMLNDPVTAGARSATVTWYWHRIFCFLHHME